MNVLTLLDKLDLDMADSISIWDRNLSQPMYVGFIGNIPLNILRKDVLTFQFLNGKAVYKDEELYYEYKVIY